MNTQTSDQEVALLLQNIDFESVYRKYGFRHWYEVTVALQITGNLSEFQRKTIDHAITKYIEELQQLTHSKTRNLRVLLSLAGYDGSIEGRTEIFKDWLNRPRNSNR